MENEDLMMKPYDRLQSILSEKDGGKLTKNASDRLDELFGDTKKESLLDKIRNLFKKIDRFIFKPGSRMNTTFYKRKN
jgi:hypothetical protein